MTPEEVAAIQFVGSVEGMWITYDGWNTGADAVRIWTCELDALRDAHDNERTALFVRWGENVDQAEDREIAERARAV